ncbi:hypothetical protein BN8_03109 [Fibrisoma limi BUZ 3]|uniref:Peptidase S12 Pab87-related C-terminal domain-containing protein n=1 Tax=Fibrisoma limi BUZ 3 TaxID=1185876 RepID=I2GJ98_9BACT|nr:DUF3471 domain-containing protein [Fibrisoma limi]CCH53973.1 hypothetical protein BN8_03109 [Fibrisoma limi BUZ 3]
MKTLPSLLLLIACLTLSGYASAQVSADQLQSRTTYRRIDNPAKPLANDLQEYAGTYSFPSGGQLQKYTVTVKDGELYGEADSYGSNKLLKQAEPDTYKSTSSYGSIIVFNRDATSKAVTSLVLKLMGQEGTATKDKP